MALHVDYPYTAGATLAISAKRLADGLFFDFADATFKATPTTPTLALTAEAGIYAGSYSVVYANTPAAVWADGPYRISVHDAGNANALLDHIANSFVGGDDLASPAGGTGTGSTVTLDGGTVSAGATTPTAFSAAGNLYPAAGGYADGLTTLRFTSGANGGLRRRVLAHSVSAGVHTFTVAAFPSAPAAGDAFQIV